ncbi:LysR family transcriptional regulator [Epibacterium ulvae]|uniref:LysR family transcriptional regulator n=1 Tax=Epibacterium ulvae TaxID=1156985 RepID=UPI00255B1DF4|nr:LysR family transcriptional regulator [Epibacterium ulvae]MBT8155726.1 LysR family transcriptional regulator [Epibacterium ulvae]
MNLSQLTVFREVMKTGSMSEAAHNLGRSQPAISLSIKSLEEALGVALFERDTRNMKPVPEAFYLLAEADSVLGQMAQLQRTMKRMQVGDEGDMQLAVMPGVATVLFPEFLAHFAKSRPDVTLSLHTRSSTQLRELVSSQGADFGFGDYDEDHSRTLQTSITKVSANSFLALPAAHPLASLDVIPLDALEGLTLGAMQPDHRFEGRVQTALAGNGVKTNVQYRSQTVLPLLKFVSAELCCAIVDPLTVLSAKLIGFEQSEVVFRNLAQDIRYDYAILVPKLRPLSALSRHLAAEWEAKLLRELIDLGSQPTRDVIN